MTLVDRLLAIQAEAEDVAWRDDMIRGLREALKFYADEENYLPDEHYPDNSPVDIDFGKIARAALEQKR
jgi:hypothetical protein